MRTLCLAYKDLSLDAYKIWNEQLSQAKTSFEDREKKVDEVFIGFDLMVLVSLKSLLVFYLFFRSSFIVAYENNYCTLFMVLFSN